MQIHRPTQKLTRLNLSKQQYSAKACLADRVKWNFPRSAFILMCVIEYALKKPALERVYCNYFGNFSHKETNIVDDDNALEMCSESTALKLYQFSGCDVVVFLSII